MFQVRVTGSRGLTTWVAAVVTAWSVTGAGAAPAPAAPPAPVGASGLTAAERSRRLEQRDRSRKEAVRLANAGDLGGAVAEAEKALVIERAVLGGSHEDVDGSMRFL